MLELTTCLAAAALLLAGVGCALWMAYLSREPEHLRRDAVLRDLEYTARRTARRLELLESAAGTLDARMKELERQWDCVRAQMEEWERLHQPAETAAALPGFDPDTFQKNVEQLLQYQAGAKKS